MSRVVKIVLCVFGFLIVVSAALYADFVNFCNRSVPVFAYHRITTNKDIYSMPPDTFEAQMKYLHDKGYRSISLNEYVAKREKEPDAFNKNFVITFDDGYCDNNRVAMPIMKKYDYTGTIFIAIKYMAWPGYVTWQDVVSLKENGWEIGSHTYNHVALAKATPEELEAELKNSKEFLNKFDPDFNVNTIAYPFGSYNDDVYNALARNGYIAAVTGIDGVNTVDTPAYQLYRVNIFNDGKDVKMFAKRLLWAQLSGWTKSHGIDITKVRRFLQ